MAVQVLTALATYRTTASANWMRVSAASVTSCVRTDTRYLPCCDQCWWFIGRRRGDTTDGTSPRLPRWKQKEHRSEPSLIKKRFMDVSPLKVEDARVLTSSRIKQLPEVLASRCRKATNIRSVMVSKLSYSHVERAVTP